MWESGDRDRWASLRTSGGRSLESCAERNGSTVGSEKSLEAATEQNTNNICRGQLQLFFFLFFLKEA